ncbi:Hsp20/alpha crystallin family protein [Candidatus Bathyarchaeota archaeon]|nr:Hsp20/alpha crystallin family protein [Candidatus Bathyarchaeota archaeon]
MSAKWRRYKKRSKRFHISRDFNKAKDKKIDQPFRINYLRIKRGTYPYKHSLLNTYRGRKWKAPKPLIDVLEEKNKIIIVAEFAGFKRENLKIHIKNQRLILSAEASDRKYHKSLNLPKRVIPSTMCTSYKNGVLEIEFEKAVKEKAIDKVVG